jgi:hypothetical protein
MHSEVSPMQTRTLAAFPSAAVSSVHQPRASVSCTTSSNPPPSGLCCHCAQIQCAVLYCTYKVLQHHAWLCYLSSHESSYCSRSKYIERYTAYHKHEVYRKSKAADVASKLLQPIASALMLAVASTLSPSSNSLAAHRQPKAHHLPHCCIWSWT